jgi:mono/diheme cytochrome c family protein
MKKLSRTLGAALVLSLIALGGAAWPQSPAAGDATNGKRVFLADGCFTCHGRSGQGGAMNYPNPVLAQTALPLEAFKIIVRAGPNDMPAYSANVLSDQELTDIHAFLRSLPGRRPADEIPLLKQ